MPAPDLHALLSVNGFNMPSQLADAILDILESANQSGALSLVDAAGSPWLGGTTAPSFFDGSGVTGAQTMNVRRGRCKIGAAASSVVITNNLVNALSTVTAVITTNDATALLKNVVPAAGSFTINLNANTTGATTVDFIVHG